jgi:hypothetical protein
MVGQNTVFVFKLRRAISETVPAFTEAEKTGR